MREVISLIKMYPMVITGIILATTIGTLIFPDISCLLYPAFGHSIYVNLLMLRISMKMHFCLWYRVLIMNLIFVNVVEWLDVNFQLFPDAIRYITMIMVITLICVVISIILYRANGCFKGTPTGSN